SRRARAGADTKAAGAAAEDVAAGAAAGVVAASRAGRIKDAALELSGSARLQSRHSLLRAVGDSILLEFRVRYFQLPRRVRPLGAREQLSLQFEKADFGSILIAHAIREKRLVRDHESEIAVLVAGNSNPQSILAGPVD
ncbi:MAG: hypothetical protein ACRD21_23140, partial [Vicinamibacteria bacterium]